MRFYFVGNAFTPDLTYRFQWEAGSNGGGVFLQDAFVRYRFADQWAVQAGQFYDEYSHEQSMLDPFMLAADRSLINALIGGGQTERVQGVMLLYDDHERWAARGALHDGANSDNTDWTEAGGGGAFIGVTDTNFGAFGRLEYFFSGTRQAYETFTALGTTEDLLVAGAEDQFHEFTIGGNYYYRKHNVKLTIDFTYLPNGVPINLPALGFLASDDDEFVIRAQFQLFI
jgi:hypothetical protein